MQPIDHDERRRMIAAVAFDVIAREGLEAATIRRIAAAAGFSTTIITHYYRDKQELMRHAYQWCTEQAHARVGDRLDGDRAAVVDGLVRMAACDEEGRRCWRVYLSFWERATRDPDVAAQQRVQMEEAMARIAAAVRRFVDGDVARLSRRLAGLIQGISVQALVDPDAWPVEAIRATLAEEIAHAEA